MHLSALLTRDAHFKLQKGEGIKFHQHRDMMLGECASNVCGWKAELNKTRKVFVVFLKLGNSQRLSEIEV